MRQQHETDASKRGSWGRRGWRAEFAKRALSSFINARGNSWEGLFLGAGTQNDVRHENARFAGQVSVVPNRITMKIDDDVECGMWNVKCEMRNVNCGMLHTEINQNKPKK